MTRSAYHRRGIVSRSARRQQGAMIPLFVIALVAMLGLVGLAVDGGHGMLNKSRLQNAVDAAALSAAKVLDETAADTVLAEAEAIATFQRNASNPGNGEMASAYGNGQIELSVQFSNTLHPFVPGTSPAQYVRVRADNFRLPGWFIPVLGFNEKTVGASAVAGPSPTFLFMACNIAPMMVCGDPGGPGQYGYELGAVTVLKTAAPGGTSEVGPGNFQLIRLDGGPGARQVREAMAGSFDSCLRSDENAETQPGNEVGPVALGLNTRFGDYFGPMQGTQDQYPPDENVGEPEPPLTYDSDTGTVLWNGQPVQATGSVDGMSTYGFYDYVQYRGDLPGQYPGGVPGRRTMAVPIGDCSGTTNGQGSVPVLGFACFHLLQKAQGGPGGGGGGGGAGNNAHVYGQFVDGCAVTGRPGPEPSSGPGPYIIQLYKDEDAEAS